MARASRRVLLDQQHPHAHLFDTAQSLEQLAADQRREAQRRLIEQQNRGVGHQRPPDRHHLPLAAAHGVGKLAHALGEAGEERHHSLVVLRCARARAQREGAELQVVVHRQVREDAPVLRYERQPRLNQPVGGQSGQIHLAQDDARPRQMRDQAAQGLEAR